MLLDVKVIELAAHTQQVLEFVAFFSVLRLADHKRTATARPTLCPVTSRSTAATASVSSMAFVTAVGQ